MPKIKGKNISDLAQDIRVNEILGHTNKIHEMEEQAREMNRVPLKYIETEVLLRADEEADRDEEEAVLFEVKDRPDLDGICVAKKHLDTGEITRFQVYQQLGLIWEQCEKQRTGN